MEKYKHPIVAGIEEKPKVGGHGGWTCNGLSFDLLFTKRTFRYGCI
jgi:hypothetical protein